MDFKAHPKHEYVVHGPGPQVQPQAKPRRACQIVVHYSTRESPPKKSEKSTTRTFLASSKPTKSNYRQPSHGTGESPESARFSGHESGREIPGARCVEAARREGRGMWWEWEEDGEEAARPGEEVPVDFDFISLLCKPKVGIATPTPRLVSSPSISPPRSFFFSVARLFMT